MYGTPQRRLNAKLDAPIGSRLDADSVEFEETHRKLEELRQRQAELEQERLRKAELERKRAAFDSGLNDLGARLVATIDSIDAQSQEMGREVERLNKIRNRFAEHIATLKRILPQTWQEDEVDKALKHSFDVLRECELDYEEGLDQCSKMKHCKIVSAARRRRRGMLLSMQDVSQEFFRGLSFHAPLAVLAIIIFILYKLIA